MIEGDPDAMPTVLGPNLPTLEPETRGGLGVVARAGAMRRAWPAFLMGGALLAAGACGPAGTTARPGPVQAAGAARSPGAEDPPEDDPLAAIERRVAEAAERARQSVLALEYTAIDAPRGPRRVASGIVIGEGGDVLSVRIDAPPSGSAPIVARDAAGREFVATWVAADPETGLTLLSIVPSVERPAVPARRGPTAGQPILVVGNPFGLGHSVSRGSVAGLDRRLELGPYRLGGLIQVDVALHPGDSGALLVDLRGGWLGVVRSGLAAPDRPEATDHDLGFAIPASDALWVAGQLRTHRRVERAYLGVIPSPRGAAPAEAPGPIAPGVGLDQVLPDSPADRAGLKPGDRLVALDGRPIRSTSDLDDRLARTAAGAEVAVAYLRGEGAAALRQSLTVRAGTRPPTDTPAPAAAERGRPKPAAAVPAPLSAPAPIAPEIAERLDRLERRIKELEAEKAASRP